MDQIKNMERKKNILEVFYIRHCNTTPYPPEGRHFDDVNISDLGEKQVELLGERFAGCEFDAVLCSPMVRAVLTAAGLCKRLSGNPVIELVPEAVEKLTWPGMVRPDGRMGFQRQSLQTLKQYYPNMIMCPDRFYGDENESFSNGTDEEEDLRAKAFVQYIRNRFTYGQRVCIVAHQYFSSYFISAALGIPSDSFEMRINNTSVTKISYYSDGTTRLSYLNDISHLRELMPGTDFGLR